MSKISIIGDDPEEIIEEGEALQSRLQISDEELDPVFKDITQIRDAIKKGGAHRDEIRSRADLSHRSPKFVSSVLHTLREAGVVTSGGKGGCWRYKKRKE